MSYSLLVKVVQRPKPQVRARILAAAEVVFAAHGFADAKMASIAEEAEVSAGNLYRYFKGKRELFEAVVTPQFVRRFETLLERRVAALASLHRPNAADSSDAAGEMLAFWIEHRLRVVILLDRSAGSPHAAFGQRFVERLVKLTFAHLESSGTQSPPEPTALILENVFQTSRRTIVSILERYEDAAEIQRAFAAFWSFQLPGLAGLEAWVKQ